MKIKNARLLSGLLLLPALLLLPNPRAEAQTSSAAIRITQAVDEKNLVTLRGNVHPLARAEFDQGAVSDAQALHRMLLLLKRSAEQEASLEKLLDDQQNKSSANYHAWLTPAQFGQQFGPADADIQTVTGWLQSHGFQVTNVTVGRTVIEFCGNAAQVRSAFHTEIHKYLVNGEVHLANWSDPQISMALVPVVGGQPVYCLTSFLLYPICACWGTFQKSMKSGETKPLFTFPGCAEFVSGWDRRTSRRFITPRHSSQGRRRLMEQAKPSQSVGVSRTSMFRTSLISAPYSALHTISLPPTSS